MSFIEIIHNNEKYRIEYINFNANFNILKNEDIPYLTNVFNCKQTKDFLNDRQLANNAENFKNKLLSLVTFLNLYCENMNNYNIFFKKIEAKEIKENIYVFDELAVKQILDLSNSAEQPFYILPRTERKHINDYNQNGRITKKHIIAYFHKKQDKNIDAILNKYFNEINEVCIFYVFLFMYLTKLNITSNELINLILPGNFFKELLHNFWYPDLGYDKQINILNLIEVLEIYADTTIINLLKQKNKMEINNDKNHLYIKSNEDGINEKKICKYCGLGFGLLWCPVKKRPAKYNNFEKCPECDNKIDFVISKCKIHENLIKDDRKVCMECNDCCRSNNKYLSGDAFSNSAEKSDEHTICVNFVSTVSQCDICQTAHNKVFTIDVEKMKYKKWITQIGLYTRNVYNHLFLIIFISVSSLIINPIDGKISFFSDINEILVSTIALNTEFMIYNITILILSFIISFIYIAREDKEYEFTEIKYEKSNINSDANSDANSDIGNDADNNFDTKEIKQYNKFKNTFIPCLKWGYSPEYRLISKKLKSLIYTIRRLENKQSISSENKDKIKKLYKQKKELHHDKLLVVVFSIFVFLSLPTSIYILIVCIEARTFTILVALILYTKIRTTWKLIKIIDILLNPNTCCSWHNEKTFKEKDDVEQITSNTTEIKIDE